ncbi:hypothetical protein ABT063_28315 [Streptomyces sp. NPDC002838]|uniref:hypothetical protein n=1 Tax=Streptomyces sp. NPDC002838 TaxID=3154436 RepID=UPI003323AC24
MDRLGRTVGRFARRPATLLAARRLSDDPNGAWRTVSGLVLAGFVAGFFSVSRLALSGPDQHGQVAVLTADSAATQRAATEARTLLRKRASPPPSPCPPRTNSTPRHAATWA